MVLALREIYGHSVSVYDPEAIVMRGIHTITGEVLGEVSAADINVRRNNDPNFKAKHYAFACPCCGDDAKVVHVKASDDGKRRAHWRLEGDSWHSNLECDLYSTAELTLRSKGIRFKRRGETGRLEAKMQKQASANSLDNFNAHNRSSKSAKSRSISVRDIVEMCWDLSADERSEIDIRIGKVRVPLDRLCLRDGRDLVPFMDAGQRDFILPVRPQWQEAKYSEHRRVWHVPCEIEHVARGNSFVEIKPQLEVAGGVFDLCETGRISQTAPLMVHVSSQYSFGSGDSIITAQAAMHDAQDFVLRADLMSCITQPAVGGVQMCMPL